MTRGVTKRGERAKALKKFMKESKSQRANDRKYTAKHVVRTASKYQPMHNDFAKLDTAAPRKSVKKSGNAKKRPAAKRQGNTTWQRMASAALKKASAEYRRKK